MKISFIPGLAYITVVILSLHALSSPIALYSHRPRVSSCCPRSSSHHCVALRPWFWPALGHWELRPSSLPVALSGVLNSPPPSTTRDLLFFLGSVVEILFVEVLVLVDLFMACRIRFSPSHFSRSRYYRGARTLISMYLTFCLYSFSLSTPLSSLCQCVSRFEAP